MAKKAKELTIEDVMEIVEKLQDTVEDLEERVDELEDSKPAKKERKPRAPIDWSTKARGMLGKKYKGWTFEQDKLNIVASKKGYDDIVVSGMKSKDDFLEMLDEQ